jgi:hypothetical protein
MVRAASLADSRRMDAVTWAHTVFITVLLYLLGFVAFFAVCWTIIIGGISHFWFEKGSSVAMSVASIKSRPERRGIAIYYIDNHR